MRNYCTSYNPRRYLINEKFDRSAKGTEKDKKKTANLGPRVNSQIRIPEMRLIGPEGEQHGIVSLSQAKALAEAAGLDLVEISPSAKPPVVKIIDYGKFKYETQKKLAENKKKQATVVLKEIQFRPNIEANDMGVKLKKIAEFFEDGHKVKLIMQFKGRELAYKQAGMEKFNNIIEQASAFGGLVESPPKLMGPRIIAMMAAVKKP